MGYDAFAIACSGDEAIKRVAERCPDVVLMDIRIKGQRDGIETATLLRESFDVPIVYLTAHADEATLDELESNGQVLFRYVHDDGSRAGGEDDRANPNGSLRAIAGVTNAAGNVAGLMPHPETAVEAVLGSDDGLGIIASFVASAAEREHASAQPVDAGAR